MAVKTSDLTVNIASQFYHSTPEPLDKSFEVEDVEDLYDNNKMPAYKGKIVHVKNGGEYGTGCSYLCTSAQVKELQDGSGLWGVVSTWQPLIEDDGSAFYFTYEEGARYFANAAVALTPSEPTVAVTTSVRSYLSFASIMSTYSV